MTLCSQSGFARQIDRYLNSIWYPVCLGALCAFSGLGGSNRYTVCMGIIAVTVFLTALFATDMKPLFAPMLMAFCALGKDSNVSYGDQRGDVMLSYNDSAFCFVILLGILAVTALIIRFWKDGTIKSLCKNPGHFCWSILLMDVAFLFNGVGSSDWVPIDIAYGALMAFGFTFFYFTCVSIAQRGANVAWYACICMVCTALLGIFQIGVVLYKAGLITVPLRIIDGAKREYIELGWGIATSIPAYLALGIPAAFYLAANHRWCLLSYLLAFAIFGAVVILGSRGPILVGAVVMPVGIVACCFGENKYFCRKFALAILVLIPICLWIAHKSGFSLWQLIQKFLQATRLDRISIKDGRISVWIDGLKRFLRAPVFGVGFDKNAFEGAHALRNVFAQMYHNIFAQFIATMGSVGILAFGLHLWQAGKLWRKPKAERVLLLLLPLMVILMSLVDNFFFYLNQQIAYCMFLAVAERKQI